jgi:hypothetical protein
MQTAGAVRLAIKKPAKGPQAALRPQRPFARPRRGRKRSHCPKNGRRPVFPIN